MTFLRFPTRSIVLVLGLGVAAIVVVFAVRRQPGEAFDPAGAPDALVAARIAGLRDDPAACTRLLDRAGIAYRTLPPRDGGACGFGDGVAWAKGGAREARYDPPHPPLACPLGVALAMWEWSVVQPAAARRFGTIVAGIDHYGSYACRRLYGRATGAWSAHARANAIDVAGFRLADGRRITVARDWNRGDVAAAFLHDVRDGACRLFATTLSPDYNAAHRDHLHLDEAPRGGGHACR